MTDEISETSRAVQEVAKATTTGIEATKSLGRFVAGITGEPIAEVTGILTDKLRFMRWEGQLRLYDRCLEIIKTRGLEGHCRTVPPKLALPIIEHASLEENDELQDLWANLLATILDPEASTRVRSAFIDIIKQLEPVDVHVLNFIYVWNDKRMTDYNSKFGKGEEGTRADRDLYLQGPVNAYLIRQELNLDESSCIQSIENLLRVRCVEPHVDYESIVTEVPHYFSHRTVSVPVIHENDVVRLTQFGIGFIFACLGVR